MKASHQVSSTSSFISSLSLQDVTEALMALGHKQGTTENFYNVVNGMEKQDGYICAVSDARKMGKAAGY